MHNYITYTDTVNALTNPLLKEKSPPILKLDMELTERCNNNCLHCNINLLADDKVAKNRELSSQKIKSILTEAASLGCMMVRFTGGEPLLRDDFEDIYLFARKLGLVVLIFTNATLITPHLVDTFSQIPPLQPIEITLYGTQEKTYESVTRTTGSFEAAMAGIHLLKNKGIPFLIKSIFLSHTISEANKFEAWVKSKTGKEQSLPSTIILDLRSRRDSRQKNHLIKEMRLPVDQVIKYLTRNPNDYVKEFRLFHSKYNFTPTDKLFTCHAGSKTVCVDAYGMVQLCMQLRHPDTVYDLKNGSLNDAILNFLPQLVDRKAHSDNYRKRCSRCFLKGFCEQCPAKSWSEHGELEKPVEYLCKITHSQAVFLDLLKKGEKAWKVKDWEKRFKKLVIPTKFHAKKPRNNVCC